MSRECCVQITQPNNFEPRFGQRRVEVCDVTWLRRQAAAVLVDALAIAQGIINHVIRAYRDIFQLRRNIEMTKEFIYNFYIVIQITFLNQTKN